MAMITRHVRCKKCGQLFPLTYPEKLSDIGLSVISICKMFRTTQTNIKEDNTNENRCF